VIRPDIGRRISRIALAIALAGTLAACGPSGRLFHTTLPSGDGWRALPVTLGDQTDLVVGIEPGPIDPFPDVDPDVRADPADPKALIVAWLGGACEDESVVVLHRGGGRYDMAVSSRGGLGSCPMVGIHRAIRIRTSEPVAIDLIDMIRGGQTIPPQ
jgi:hypothetical protein